MNPGLQPCRSTSTTEFHIEGLQVDGAGEDRDLHSAQKMSARSALLFDGAPIINVLSCWASAETTHVATGACA